MEVQQIHTLMNSVTSEILGTEIVNENLTNVVDVGTELFNATSVDNYVKTLVDRIGKTIFVNRPYSGNIPSIFMDSWEYGSILEKIASDIPKATENESWELKNGQEYSQDIFYKPTVSAKFFNNKVTFEVPMSFTERQVKESFNGATELNGFLSMLYNAVDKSMTIKIDSLVMRTINSMIAQTMFAEFPDVSDNKYSAVTGVKAINLLKKYNEQFGTSITADKAITTPEFIRYASYKISLYIDRFSKISKLFNIGGKDRFTPKDKLHIVMLSDFMSASKIYLESDTYNNKLVEFPTTEVVPYWQGSGTNYNFTDVSKINVTYGDKTLNTSGILCTMFDTESCGVCNTDKRVTTAYNAKAEFYNNFYKFDASYFNDTNENFIVFFIA